MAISSQCVCGAKVRLPDSAAGKRARCRACGQVFRVPAKPAEEQDSSAPIDIAPYEAEGPSIASPPPASPSPPYEGLMPGARALDGDWIEDSGRSFWADAAWSFGFFLEGGNIVTLIVLCLLRMAIQFFAMLPLFGCWALTAQAFLAAWLFAFYFNIITETARGEDGLPDVWVASIFDDLILPGVRFVACSLAVFLPAVAAAFLMLRNQGEISWNVVWLIAALGVFFWPVMALGTAIGGGLPLASVPVLILTVAKTFLPYLAVCLLVAIAMAIPIASEEGLDMLLASAPGAKISTGGAIALRMAIGGVEVYAWIVAMRLIGLYYRHFKSRFPWVAE